MYAKLEKQLQEELESIKQAGLYKSERIIMTSQGTSIRVKTGEEVLNFCANNYLGLSNNQELISYAKENMQKCGFGMSSVRFISVSYTHLTLPTIYSV